MNDGGSQPRNRKLPSLYKYRQDYNSILRKVNWGKAENLFFNMYVQLVSPYRHFVHCGGRNILHICAFSKLTLRAKRLSFSSVYCLVRLINSVHLKGHETSHLSSF
jgi:hypothetical protein